MAALEFAVRRFTVRRANWSAQVRPAFSFQFQVDGMTVDPRATDSGHADTSLKLEVLN